MKSEPRPPHVAVPWVSYVVKCRKQTKTGSLRPDCWNRTGDNNDLPSSFHDSSFPSLLHNNERQWPRFPLMTMMTSLHHFTTTDGNGQQQRQFPFHHFTTYDDFPPSPHDLPIPFSSLLSQRVSMSMWQEGSFTTEQVGTTVMWRHVSLKHPSLPMWPQLIPVVPWQRTDYHRTICINR